MADNNAQNNDGNKSKNEQDVDKGYSWIVLTASFFMYLFVLGSVKCFGVLYTEMLDHFSAGSGNTAWIGSIAWFLLLILAPLANVLSRRFSFRSVIFVGGVMVGSGYFLSGFVNRMELMYLTFTLVGVGYGLSYTCSATIISYYFKKRRTLANGIMASASGIAVLIFPFIYRFLIDKYGLSQAFWVIGAILSNICVASCVYRQPKSLQNDQETSDNGARLGRQEDKSMKMCLGTLNLKFSLFKKRRFVLLLTAITLCTIGSDNNYVLIPAHIKALGYSNTYVTLGVSIVGGTEMITRIFTGWFADLNIMSKIHIFVICTFVGGAMALISPLFDSFTFMAVYAFVAGAFPSTYIALFAVLAIECVGMEDFPAAFTFISIFMALAYLINLPVSGWLADYNGNWHLSFIFTGITLTCSGIAALLENVINRFCMNKKYSLERNKANVETIDIQWVSREGI